MAEDRQIKFRVPDDIYKRLELVVTEQEGSVAGLARQRTLRTIGITPDGLDIELTVSLTQEEWNALTHHAKAHGTQPYELARTAVLAILGREGKAEQARQALRLAHDGQREEALDRGLGA